MKGSRTPKKHRVPRRELGKLVRLLDTLIQESREQKAADANHLMQLLLDFKYNPSARLK